MQFENNVIFLGEKYDSTNAPQLEKEVMAILDTFPADSAVVLDAAATRYISSAGLRVLMKIKKRFSDLSIIHVSSEVYEILDITGFNSMMKVKKAYRVLSLDGAEEIGHGLSSVVYRIDRETIVKVYNSRVPLHKIEREVEFARKSFLFGIPTRISYDIVKCGDQYGTVYELVDSQVLSVFLRDHPQCFDEYAGKYIRFLQEIHETPVDESFADIKQLWLSGVDMLSSWFTGEESAKLKALIAAVPDRNTFVHSDIHTNNVMLGDDGLVLIDMADVGRGHPIFDIGPLFFHYHFMEQANPQMADDLMVIPHDMREQMWGRLKTEYLADPDPVKHEKLIEIYNCFGAIRCALLVAKHAQMENDKKASFIRVMKDYVFPRADAVLALIRQYL